jgi:hypothetical protein
MEVRMSESSLAPIRTWLTAPMTHDVSEAIERLRRAPDVQQIDVMPAVHLATDVCSGVVVATSQVIYPQAVGGDIGCAGRIAGCRVGANGNDRGLQIRVRQDPFNRRGQPDARYSPARHELGTGSHASDLQLLLGHADLKTTQRYLNVTDEELRKTMQEKLWKRGSAK